MRARHRTHNHVTELITIQNSAVLQADRLVVRFSKTFFKNVQISLVIFMRIINTKMNLIQWSTCINSVIIINK